MQGLYNLLNNIRWNMGPCFLWMCSEGDRYAAHLPPDRWLTAILIWTADDMRVRASPETLGTPWSWNFASINNLAPGCMWQVMPPAGKVWYRKSNFFHPDMNNTKVGDRDATSPMNDPLLNFVIFSREVSFPVPNIIRSPNCSTPFPSDSSSHLLHIFDANKRIFCDEKKSITNQLHFFLKQSSRMWCTERYTQSNLIRWMLNAVDCYIKWQDLQDTLVGILCGIWCYTSSMPVCTWWWRMPS